MSRPLIIAHRGASGVRPEHTRAAYLLAIEQGADVIEPDLVMSRDGELVVRHENHIDETTDVDDRPAFAARRRTCEVDGRVTTGWFTEDFTLAELKQLRARERLPLVRPGNMTFDGQDEILTFQEVLDIAREASERLGKTIGVAPELKHPSHFVGAGLPMEDAFVAVLEANGLTGPDAPLLIQCFEIGPLQRLAERIDTPRLQLMSAVGGPVDRPGLTYATMATAVGLGEIAPYAGYIGAELDMILPRDVEGRSGPPTSLVEDAHAAGLKVAAWTLRAENLFLPLERRKGDSPVEHGDLQGWLADLLDAGVDAVFTDFPGEAAGYSGLNCSSASRA